MSSPADGTGAAWKARPDLCARVEAQLQPDAYGQEY